jgi:hypothetical protein
MLMNWRHSGFNVFCGSRIQPGDEKAMENLARTIIRASFSQERMAYIPDEPKVVYQAKDGLVYIDELLKSPGVDGLSEAAFLDSFFGRDVLPTAPEMRDLFVEAGLSPPDIVDIPGRYMARGVRSR